MPRRRRPGAHRLRRLGFTAIAAVGVGNMTLQHGIGDGRIDLRRTAAGRSMRTLSLPAAAHLGKRRQTAANPDLAAKVIDQHRHVGRGKVSWNISAARHGRTRIANSAWGMVRARRIARRNGLAAVALATNPCTDFAACSEAGQRWPHKPCSSAISRPAQWRASMAMKATWGRLRDRLNASRMWPSPTSPSWPWSAPRAGLEMAELMALCGQRWLGSRHAAKSVPRGSLPTPPPHGPFLRAIRRARHLPMR